MRAWTLLLLAALTLGGSCASDGEAEMEPMVEESSGRDGASVSVESGAPGRSQTERRLQLERSVDQWWLAFQRQEYAKSDGIASALESYVNEHFEDVLADLRTASPRFRKVAAAALGFSGKAEAAPPLVEALRDPFADVILAALLSMRQLALSAVDIPTGPVTPYLGHADEHIRSNAAMVLAHSAKKGQGELFLPLTNAMEDSSASVRSHAAAALGVLGEPDAIPFLTKGLTDQKALVRIRSAFALGRIHDRRAVPALIAHLDDPDVDVAKSVHKALRTITGQDLPRIKKEWEAFWARQPREG